MALLWILALLLALLPAVLMLWYIRHLDKYEPEPWSIMAAAFFAGCLSVIPAAIIEGLLASTTTPGFLGSVYTAFLVVGLTEELCKGACTFAAVWRRPHFNEIMDGIVYFGVGHMGFAVTENLKYVLLDSGGDPAASLMIAFVRSTTAVPLHIVVGMIMGYHLGAARFMRGGWKRLEHVGMALGLPVLLHGVYDVAALNQNVGSINTLGDLLTVGFSSALLYAAVVALWLFLIPRVRHAQAASPYRPGAAEALPVAPVPCARCGAPYPVAANFCPTCGEPISRRSQLRQSPLA